jgi:hypothetical protein
MTTPLLPRTALPRTALPGRRSPAVLLALAVLFAPLLLLSACRDDDDDDWNDPDRAGPPPVEVDVGFWGGYYWYWNGYHYCYWDGYRYHPWYAGRDNYYYGPGGRVVIGVDVVPRGGVPTIRGGGYAPRRPYGVRRGYGPGPREHWNDEGGGGGGGGRGR